MELKAINITQKAFDSDDDFFFSCEAFIGPETMPYVYEVYDFNVISIKRLSRTFPDHGIMLNKGWLIVKNYNEQEIKDKIISIIGKCTGKSDEDTYKNLCSYFRIQKSL